MTSSEMSLEGLRSELLERLARAERRTQLLEARFGEAPINEAPLDETPRPARGLKRPAIPPHDVILRTVASSLNEVIWSTSPEGDRVYVLAGGVERLLERPAEEFLERPGLWMATIPDGERASYRAALREPAFEIEHGVTTSTGLVRRARSRGKLVRAADGTPLRVDGISMAIGGHPDNETEGENQNENESAARRIRELESQLASVEAHSRESERLATVGRLLAGAAHDFNNFLTLVTGHADLIRDHLASDDPLRESAELIAASGHGAARLARQLIQYTKPLAHDPGLLDPNLTLRDLEPLLRRLLKAEVEIDFLLTSPLAPIRIDRSEFDRVVVNLVMNARDAIGEAGVISVRTALASVPANRRSWPKDCPPGEYVALTVTDTGCGMSEDVKARAFTRYFTTKGKNGTGLGLATVFDIVTKAGGHVELESAPEWGTSIRIFLPAVPDGCSKSLWG